MNAPAIDETHRFGIRFAPGNFEVDPADFKGFDLWGKDTLSYRSSTEAAIVKAKEIHQEFSDLDLIVWDFDNGETVYRTDIEPVEESATPKTYKVAIDNGRGGMTLIRASSAQEAWDWCLDWAKGGDWNGETEVTAGIRATAVNDPDDEVAEDATFKLHP
jgi:hypothetical protein